MKEVEEVKEDYVRYGRNQRRNCMSCRFGGMVPNTCHHTNDPEVPDHWEENPRPERGCYDEKDSCGAWAPR